MGAEVIKSKWDAGEVQKVYLNKLELGTKMKKIGEMADAISDLQVQIEALRAAERAAQEAAEGIEADISLSEEAAEKNAERRAAKLSQLLRENEGWKGAHAEAVSTRNERLMKEAELSGAEKQYDAIKMQIVAASAILHFLDGTTVV